MDLDHLPLWRESGDCHPNSCNSTTALYGSRKSTPPDNCIAPDSLSTYGRLYHDVVDDYRHGHFSPEVCGPPTSFSSVGSTSSGRFMDLHQQKLTPSESSASPTIGVDLGRLSLEYDEEPRVVHGRATKRAASSDLPRQPGGRLGTTTASKVATHSANTPNNAPAHPWQAWHDSGYEPKKIAIKLPQQAIYSPPHNTSRTRSLPRPCTSSRSDAECIGLSNIPPKTQWPELILQPDSSPISEIQLANEGKNIYAGLVIVGSQCTHLDAAQASNCSCKLDEGRWRALEALHRTSPYEHHGLLMAKAPPASLGHATAYSRDAMQKHGVHLLLRILHDLRPEDWSHLESIRRGCEIMGSVQKAVPELTDFWLHCSVDLVLGRWAPELGTDKDDPLRNVESNWAALAELWNDIDRQRSPNGRTSPDEPSSTTLQEATKIRPLSEKFCFRDRTRARSIFPPDKFESELITTVKVAQADRALYHRHQLALRDNGVTAVLADPVRHANRRLIGCSRYLQNFWKAIEHHILALASMMSRGVHQWRHASPAISLGLLLRLQGANALPTGQASSSRELSELSSTGGSIIPLPLILVCVGAASVYDALSARRLLQARLNTWLILAGVLGLVWCVLRMSGEEATYALPTAFTAWLAAWTSLIASCARLLQQKTAFVLLSIFIGGGAPVLTLALLPRADAVTPGSPVQTARETIDIAGPLIATAWTLVVYFFQRLCRY
ncbi:hypothetical protein LTR10_003599 [Elasticomyces elasticus]|nr:hypothetical protein LTR10_003599 [Elasticomyces elasticus]KAK4978208.1 hypothetical protein LTR42_002586 [Elasticomyces elasticus]